jgi:uncharacterized protein HemX
VPSVSPPLARSAAVAACAALLGAGAAGCSTTQEKAEHQRAESKRILEAREQRQKRKHQQGKSSHPDQKKGSEKG